MCKIGQFLCICFAFLLTGCGALPVDVGMTVSARPQFTIQGCVLSADPIVVGQPHPDVACYGLAKGYLLLGARTKYSPGAIS